MLVKAQVVMASLHLVFLMADVNYRVIYLVEVKERNKAVLSGHADLNRLHSQL